MVAFYDTFATYVGDGVTTDFAIPFPRIDDLDILVRIDDVDTAYTLISTSMIRLSPAPAVGELVRIQRATDVATIEATFQAGSPIPATQVNLDFRQLLYSCQEANDLRNVWYRTNGVPDASLGKQGDWAIDESTGDLYQKISDLTWQSTISLIGPSGTTWLSGTGVPSTGIGKVTDWYLDDANGDVYEKTGITTWTLRDNLTGPQGPVGPAGADGISPTGDVEGAASSTNNAVARYDGTTGKVLQDSLVTIADDGKITVPATSAVLAPFSIPPGPGVSAPTVGDFWHSTATGLNIETAAGTKRLASLDIANTWGSGFKQTFQSDATNAAIRLDPFITDPSALTEGDMWYNSADDLFKVRGPSYTYTLAYREVQLSNTQTGTSYAPVLSDMGKVVTLNNAAAITLTIQPEATYAWEAGARLDFISLGAGDVTITPGAGVTINSRGGALTSNGQYAAFSLYKTGTNVWVAFGDLIA